MGGLGAASLARVGGGGGGGGAGALWTGGDFIQTTVISAQEFQTWGVCSQSQRQESA